MFKVGGGVCAMTHPLSLSFAPSSSMGATSVWASGLLVLRLLLLVAGDQGEWGQHWGGGTGRVTQQLAMGQQDGMRLFHSRTFCWSSSWVYKIKQE